MEGTEGILVREVKRSRERREQKRQDRVDFSAKGGNMGESLRQNGGLVDRGRKMRLSRNLCKMSSWLLICRAGD